MNKKSELSEVIMTQLVMPNDTNHLGNLMGGNLMRWMDMVAAMAAMRHCSLPVVTVAVDNISFKHPIPLGSITTLEAFVTKVFNTSMEVYVRVYAEQLEGEPLLCNDAYLSFVALDKNTQKPMKAPKVVPSKPLHQEKFDTAPRRRELRLIMSGRIAPQDAETLKEMFSNLTE